MLYQVRFLQAALDDLSSIHGYLLDHAGKDRSDRFIRSVFDHCASLQRFPQRGTGRDDILSGLRLIPYRRAVTIIIRIVGKEVHVARILYRGVDLDRILLSLS